MPRQRPPGVSRIVMLEGEAGGGPLRIIHCSPSLGRGCRFHTDVHTRKSTRTHTCAHAVLLNSCYGRLPAPGDLHTTAVDTETGGNRALEEY